MKMNQKDSEKVGWDHMSVGSQNRAMPKLMVWLFLFVSVTYVVYTLKLLSSSSYRGCDDGDLLFSTTHNRLSLPQSQLNSTASQPQTPNFPAETHHKTELKHVVFGIAASAKLWDHRKNYIKLWWKPKHMRGVVWVDSPVKTRPGEGLPRVKVSSDTSRFAYTNRQGHRSAIRISRIVSETFRLGIEDVRWFVMGDDDTVFVTENLIRVLSKYDHNQYYYIGSLSESHLQNIYFSYNMAYGGGGFAISYPLAKALERMQDRCIQRYPGLFASDDRMQACMAELGVPLTKELGFHQYDVYGNLFGLLAAHPVTPLVSMHHLDVVEPIFPNVTQVEALQRLKIPMKLDSAGLIQQSICYDSAKKWTVSVSWGFAVQVFRSILSPREIEMPSRTFLNWYRRADYTAYAFNTRPVSRNPCQKPFVFYLSKARLDSSTNQTVSEYSRHRVTHPTCRWKMPDPADLDRVEVYKKPDPHLWYKSPRRNCCRIISSKARSLVVDVGVCREGEISEI
ncbi:Glycoprotein-N-acetylgalactosamine 3-beta-galactosyltransferase [Actinidia chinensis var. chinensis]|uniref:Glycoprotein-N-acetylgalactosamine 3-beta-galactosyltransferase n=1 Tax=Actinidia chinensis var. chinensis TaxID=1590841 RepID=A0A2R6Q8G6_ACTCC|nr:Glycoprotein-N-acetylgalactosamine 3-beta-galactosyltransferase [Actinidia chinensis var. chinensis]